MSPLRIGDLAPEVPDVSFSEGPTGLFFYKVTCPTCQLAAPTMAVFHETFPGRMIGVGQDAAPDLERFTDRYGMGIASLEDAPPYRLSNAYAVESVPTLYLVGDDRHVLETVGAWDRTGFNRVAVTLAELLGVAPVVVSSEDDGRPAFKPG